jgi:glycosyltransferase involved in cell wall biosynthesis
MKWPFLQVEKIQDGPWLIPLSQRLELLRKRKKRVAFLAEEPNATTFRYRCYTVAEAVNLSDSTVSAAWFYATELSVLLEAVDELSVLVLSRIRFTKRLETLVNQAQRHGVKVVFDCDDLVFAPTEINLIMETLDVYSRPQETLDQQYDYWFSYIFRLNATAQLADECTVSTEELASQAKKVLSKPVTVIRNVASHEQVSISREIVSTLPNRTDGDVIFGYFSGSPSHNKDFALVVDALANTFRSDQRCRLVIVGLLDLPNWFTDKFSDRISIVPLLNYRDLLRVISLVDFNLAPLQTNAFTACKSELKFFDAAFVDVPTIATNFGTIKSAVEDVEACLLTDNEDWLDALEHASEMSPSDRLGYVDRGRELAEKEFTTDAFLEKVVDFYETH